MNIKILSKSAKKTKEVGEILAKNLEGGEIIALFGNLGTGKTTFIQGLSQGLAVKDNVSSPTFVIFKKHKVERNKKIKWLYHFDLYRINTFEEILDLGFEEIIKNDKNVIVIEWAEKIENILPKDYLKVKIKYINKTIRKIIFDKGLTGLIKDSLTTLSS